MPNTTNPPKNDKDDSKKEYVNKAPPPPHAIAFVIAIFAICISILPSWESIDETATVKTFTNILFPEVIGNDDERGLLVLGSVRWGFSLLVLGVILRRFFFEGEDICIAYAKESKLRSVPIPIRGIYTLAQFTPWSWTLLGISFFLSGSIPLLLYNDIIDENTLQQDYQWILRMALLTFETAAPCSFLVSFVVTYAIWPQNIAKGVPTIGLKKVTILLMHNANIMMSLSEVGLLGGIPVRLCDFGVAPLFGSMYVLFSWVMIDHWTKEKNDPQFLYHFFDTTLGGGKETIAILVLLVVLMVAYGLFSKLGDLMVGLGGGVLVNVGVLGLIAMLVCRFRD